MVRQCGPLHFGDYYVTNTKRNTVAILLHNSQLLSEFWERKKKKKKTKLFLNFKLKYSLRVTSLANKVIGPKSFRMLGNREDGNN